jgi:L-fucose mutarotase
MTLPAASRLGRIVGSDRLQAVLDRASSRAIVVHAEERPVLKTRLLHPGILEALGTAGHGSQVLIADGNYPLRTHSNPVAQRVYLNVAPGLVSVTDVLAVLAETIPIEAVSVMVPDEGDEPAVFAEFRRLVPGVALRPIRRFDFYAAARGQDLVLGIATGEQRLYANALLTIGVVPPG